LDLHELVAFQANGLIKLKKSVRNVSDQALQSLYIKAINAIQNNLQELVQFLSICSWISIAAAS